MKNYKPLIILINLIMVLVLFNRSVFKKETVLSDGQLVLLELTPVDPRSLMQGDYMRLNYAISDGLHSDNISKRGFCVVTLDDNGVAKRERLQDGKTPRNDKEYLIKYQAGDWNRVSIGAESFFFQEGKALKFEAAKYGGLKVDQDGNSILIGLYDKDRKLIK